MNFWSVCHEEIRLFSLDDSPFDDPGLQKRPAA
jgi:hypothetical protein